MHTPHSLPGALFQREEGLARQRASLKDLTAIRSNVRRLAKEYALEGHRGCVNTVAWNTLGTLLVTGSDDQCLNIWDPFERKLLQSIESGHVANIFSAKFMTGSEDRKIVSCDASGLIRLTDLETNKKSSFRCHDTVTFEVVPDPESPHVFFSCSEDGTVRRYDLREKVSCMCNCCRDDVIAEVPAGVAALCFKPLDPAVFSMGCWDSHVRTFDRRNLSLPTYDMCPSFLEPKARTPRSLLVDPQRYKTTSLRYNHDGNQLLVSYSNDHVYLIQPNAPEGASHFTPQAPPTPQSRPAPRFTYRGDWSDTGPDSGTEEAPPHPLVARVANLFEDIMSIASQQAEESESSSSDMRLDQPGEEQQQQPPRAPSSSHKDKDIIMCYKGHRNCHTMIKEAGFFGSESQFVMSGSDDGRIFFWDTHTGEIVNYVVGDKHVVNCLQPHPSVPMLATSGIDYDVKIWTPTGEPHELADLQEVVERNTKLMRQREIAIPPSILLQFLTATPQS